MATLYQSSDTDAPQLDGTTGALLDVLRAVLVNGYTGKSAAGWTEAFTAPTKDWAVFRNGASTARDLYVDDNGTGANSFREARMRGFEQVTSLDDTEVLGVKPFPQTSQSAAGIICRKSTSLDATSRSWEMIADSERFVLLVDSGDSFGWSVHWFGRIDSHISSDPYDCLIFGRHTEGSVASYSSFYTVSTGALTQQGTNNYLDRSYDGLVDSVNPAFHTDSMLGATSLGKSTQVLYPNTTNGKLMTGPLRVGEFSTDPGTRGSAPDSVYRGDLPWLRDIFCNVQSTVGLADGDTFTIDGTTYMIRFIPVTAAVAIQRDNL